MTVPGFTGNSALTASCDYYRPIAKHRDRLVVRPRDIRLQTEPAASGRAAWRALQDACSLLQCAECRESCHRFINGIHDIVNASLGKAIQRPDDLHFLSDALKMVSDEMRLELSQD